MYAFFYALNYSGTNICGTVDASGMYTVDLPTTINGVAASYFIDLEGSTSTLTFRSSLLKLDTLQSGTLDLTLKTQSIDFNLIDQFRNTVSGASITALSTAPLNGTGTENTVQYSSSNLSVSFPGYTSWSRSSIDNTITDSAGNFTAQVLSNTAYNYAVFAPPNSNYALNGTGGGCAVSYSSTPWTGHCIIFYNSYGDLPPTQYTHNQPSFSWTAYPGADHYSIYREIAGADSSEGLVGDYLATTTSLSYTDTTVLSEGTYAYSLVSLDANNNVLAVSAGGQQYFITVDRTAPLSSGLSMSKTSINAKTGPITITVNSASDPLAGMGTGEYYVDTDPGTGNGTPMAFTGTGLAATTSSLSALPRGTHQLYARAVDRAGNWSSPLSISFTVH